MQSVLWLYRITTGSPRKHDTLAASSGSLAQTSSDRSGHRPNSMERAASHKVEQWLSCSTSRLAADSTLSPKVSV
jgi:hypothetical protein